LAHGQSGRKDPVPWPYTTTVIPHWPATRHQDSWNSTSKNTSVTIPPDRPLG